MIRCEFCRSEYHESIYQKGTCGNCGGPAPEIVEAVLTKRRAFANGSMFDVAMSCIMPLSGEDFKEIRRRVNADTREALRQAL